MERLQLSGFEVNPAMRTQMIRILDTMGKDYLRKPEELKYLLSPIFVKSAEQQELFYQLFDNYLEDVQSALPQPPPPIPWYQKIPIWAWGLLALTLLSILAYSIYINLPEPEPELNFGHDTVYSVGDTAHFINQCTGVPPGHEFVWEIIDQEGEIEHRDTTTGDFHYPLTKAGNPPTRKVRLTLLHHPEEKNNSSESEFYIQCAIPPLVFKENWLDSIGIDQAFTFSLSAKDDRNYRYQWIINQDTFKQADKTLSYQFDHKGFYNIEAFVELPDADGICSKIIEHTLVAFDDNIPPALVQKNLIKEADHSLALFKPGWWQFLALLALWPLLLLYRWWKYKPKREAQKPAEEMKRVLDAPDKAPYFIPFRPKAHLIQAGKELYEFANTLRQRQEGLRKELNVQKSLKATIEQGGFPAIQVDRSTQPSEYLFLIDEQHRDSIQSRLYEYLVDFLLDKDVYADRYFYNREPYSLWKKKEEEALTLQQIQRNHPYYRLVVMGDAHRWLSESGTDAEEVKREYTDWIQRWQKRTLLTPTPPKSWTFKESGLYKWLPVFPSDIQGITSAFDDIQEQNEEEDAQVPFVRWQQNQNASRGEHPDVNYRKWRKLDTLKDYLKDHPPLWQWLCALAVHPEISWELTLALGEALKDKNVEVNFDNLLILSRIPWLQQGHFPPKLRLALIKELEDDTEIIARNTLKEELEAVANLTKSSFVNCDVQAGIIVQNFLLEPTNVEHQIAIRSLTQGKNPLLGKGRIKELDQQIKKYQVQKGENATGLNSFLESQEDQVQTPELKAPNPHTGHLLTASLLWLSILLLSLWYNGSETLYKRAFGDHPTANETIRESKETFIIIEHFEPPDEAAQINNQAVELYQNDKIHSGTTITKLFEEAIALRDGDYPLAEFNRRKHLYNQGILDYKTYFETLRNRDLQNAKNQFSRAAKHDSLYLDALHGIGLMQWFDNDSLSADTSYQAILKASSSFFDTLQIEPNLEHYLRPKINRPEKPKNFNWKGIVMDSVLNQPINRVLITGTDIRTRTDRSGLFQIKSSKEELNLSFFAEGYQKRKINFTYGEDLTIKLNPSPSQVSKDDLDGDGVPNTKDKCPDEAGTVKNAGCPEKEEPLKPGSFKDTRDGQVYNTVKIGKQTWILENMNYKSSGSSCYDNYNKNCDNYGRLYNWQAAQKACPQGFHLPTVKEWQELVDNYGQKGAIGYQELTDKGDRKFAALLAGTKYSDGSYDDQENYGYFWTASDLEADLAQYFYLEKRTYRVDKNNSSKQSQMSCRCVKGDATKTSTKPIPPELVDTRGGSFLMGCNEKGPADCSDTDSPTIMMKVYPFEIGKNEVTVREYLIFVNDTKSNYPVWLEPGNKYNVETGSDDKYKIAGYSTSALNLPIVGVTWNNAKAYCEWLSKKTGKRYRLPGEAEWEFAARGGYLSKDYQYSGGNEIGGVAWWKFNKVSRLRKDVQKKPNELGIYNMSGNVAEWCEDSWAPNIEDLHRQYDGYFLGKPYDGTRGKDGDNKVIRGGSYQSVAKACQVFARDYQQKNTPSELIGFRVVQQTIQYSYSFDKPNENETGLGTVQGNILLTNSAGSNGIPKGLSGVTISGFKKNSREQISLDYTNPPDLISDEKGQFRGTVNFSGSFDLGVKKEGYEVYNSRDLKAVDPNKNQTIYMSPIGEAQRRGQQLYLSGVEALDREFSKNLQIAKKRGAGFEGLLNDLGKKMGFNIKDKDLEKAIQSRHREGMSLVRPLATQLGKLNLDTATQKEKKAYNLLLRRDFWGAYELINGPVADPTQILKY